MNKLNNAKTIDVLFNDYCAHRFAGAKDPARFDSDTMSYQTLTSLDRQGLIVFNDPTPLEHFESSLWHTVTFTDKGLSVFATDYRIEQAAKHCALIGQRLHWQKYATPEEAAAIKEYLEQRAMGAVTAIEVTSNPEGKRWRIVMTEGLNTYTFLEGVNDSLYTLDVSLQISQDKIALEGLYAAVRGLRWFNRYLPERAPQYDLEGDTIEFMQTLTRAFSDPHAIADKELKRSMRSTNPEPYIAPSATPKTGGIDA